MNMPGRKFSAGSEYRYGFNGKELDKDMDGNCYDYGFRIYNPALGRFLSVDPLFKSYPWYTPYQFAGNMPIIAIDVDGREPEIVVDKKSKEVHVNVKFTYTDASLKVLESQGLSLNTIKSGFDYYYKPNANGVTSAVEDATKITGKSLSELETKLGGKIATGGDGYFLVDTKSEGTYKVFFSLSIDKNLSTKDITVNTLEVHEKKSDEKFSYAYGKAVSFAISKTSNAKSFGRLSSHEIGHLLGLSDYYLVCKDNPFIFRSAHIPVVVDGMHKEYDVGPP